MGKRSVAEKICADMEKADPRPRAQKLVIYDFAGKKIPSRFFDNLKRVFRLMHDGWMLQYSVIAARRMQTALAVVELVKYYGCKNARVYAVEELA